jgi:hypothetical protein
MRRAIWVVIVDRSRSQIAVEIIKRGGTYISAHRWDAIKRGGRHTCTGERRAIWREYARFENDPPHRFQNQAFEWTVHSSIIKPSTIGCILIYGVFLVASPNRSQMVLDWAFGGCCSPAASPKRCPQTLNIILIDRRKLFTNIQIGAT